MSKREIVSIKVVAQERHEAGPFVFDGRLDEVIASLVAIRESIPEPYRGEATCEITSVTDFDYHVARIDIEYPRPETDAEIAAREAKNAQAEAARVAEQRRQYEALKAKFG